MITFEDGEKSNDIEEIYKYVYDTLSMKGDEADAGIDKWEQMHFFLQLIRIPKLNDCNIIRLCQIAYNIGQYLADINDLIYTKEVKKYFKKNKLSDIKSYVDDECLDKLNKNNLEEIIKLVSSKLFLIEQNGGDVDYYKKYLKYKTKYINSK